MQGLREGGPTQALRMAPADLTNKALSTVGLTNLRKSTRWAGPPRSSSVSGATNQLLQNRLEELLVFELKKDGERSYLNLSVRGLYKYVLAAITHRAVTKVSLGTRASTFARDTVTASTFSRDTVTAGSSIVEGVMASPTPLGFAMAGSQTDGSGSPAQTHEQDVQGSSYQQTNPHASGLSPLPRSGRKASVGCVGDLGEKEGKEVGVTYRERLGGYLHPRDMRRLVTPFSATNEPELIVRRHVMLLNFDPLRAIILRDRLLVIVPDGADSVLVKLEQRISGVDMADSIFGAPSENLSTRETGDPIDVPEKDRLSNLKRKGSFLNFFRMSQKGSSGPQEKATELPSTPSVQTTEERESDLDEDDDDYEWEEMEGQEWIDLPFELKCLDAVLNCVCEILSEDTYELQQASLGYIQRIVNPNVGIGDDPLTIIRAVKDAVREMSSRVKGFVQSITRTLDEDEDMALMNLSRLLTHPQNFIQPVPEEVLEEESDEPELILESALQVALSLANALDLIQGQIDTAAELVDQQLDAVRNRLLFANMMLSVVTLCLTAASLVGSIFGMNLHNYLEEDPNAFAQVTSGTVAASFCLGAVIVVVLFYSGTMPRTGLSTNSGGVDP